ncbi:MAG: WYL domain-containing protein [Bacteroidales bacterium]|nr:WYL domain-containing protein [Bacteroidales bacterium]
MKSYALFQEYIWLVNTIRRYGRLTLEEINDRWLDTEMSEGQPIARSTFNRHRDAILDMFGIIIDCDRKDGFRYYIYNEEVLREESIQNWMLSTLSVNSVLAESKGVHDRILLEQIPSDGENLHRFIDAMKRGVRIRVNYRRYGAEASNTSMKLDPYFVRLFNRRWYGLVKFPEPTGNLFTLAFDRIVSLEVTGEKFSYPKDFDPAGWFRDCYGIVRDPSEPVEKVVVRAFGKEVNYLRDLPLHHSQKEVGQGEGYSDFELRLRPTADFFSPLLARGAALKVLEPQWLADEIRRLHQESFELYK